MVDLTEELETRIHMSREGFDTRERIGELNFNERAALLELSAWLTRVRQAGIMELPFDIDTAFNALRIVEQTQEESERLENADIFL